MKIIAISGPDGSGKSTFSKLLTEELRSRFPGTPVVQLWLRWNPRVSEPQAARPVSTLDSRHRGHRAKRLLKRIGLRRVWIEAAVRSYRRQLLWQLGSIPPDTILIADRFVADFCADLIGQGVMDAGDVGAVAGRLPSPDVPVILTCPDAVLIERKDPAEDAALIVARAALYRDLAGPLDALLIDTRDPGSVDQVLDNLRQVLEVK